MMIKRLFCFLTLFLFWPVFANSSPSITGLSGTAADRANITISGSSFGRNVLDIEWTGNNIETGLVGENFSKSSWTVDGTSGGTAFYPSKYSDAMAHSGTKSIISQYPEESYYGCGYGYDYGSEFGEFYATWWVYFDHVDSLGQWKKWRLSSGPSWTKYNADIYENNWYKEDGSHRQSVVILTCGAEYYGDCYPGEDSGLKWILGQPTDTWVRIELYAKESSEPGVRDGTYILNYYFEGEAPRNVFNWDKTVITRAAGISERWRYMKFQNYWGNIQGGDGTKEKIYIDDIFIQIGSQARVEIGDNATWANCTHKEIQVPSAWSNTSITATINQGSFNNGDSAYLFVVDGDGNASNGYPITIAGSAPPSPPSGLKVVD
jgi:hypothetical protein